MERLSERDVSMAVGRLFTVRTEVNLNAALLRTPDYFWEDDQYEPQYQIARKYLEISKRLDVLNKKLDVVGNLLDVLQTQLTNEHANKLEYIIVVLILLEVVIQVVWNILIKDILQWVPGRGAVVLSHSH